MTAANNHYFGDALLGRLRARGNAWVRGRLWLQVVIGLVAGLIAGTLLGPDSGLLDPETARIVGAWVALPGKLFLGLIAMVLVPLVAGSIVRGLNGAADVRQLRAVGLRFTVFVVATTIAAAVLGTVLALVVRPGDYVALPVPTGMDAVPPPAKPLDGSVWERVPELVGNLLPTNPAQSVLEGDMLAIVIVSILVGIAAATVNNRQRIEPFLNLVDSVLVIAMTVVKWAMFLAPWAVFGLMAQLVARVGLGTVVGMGAYVLTVLAGLAGLFVLYFVILAVFGRTGPADFERSVAGVQVLAFSTSSSAAVMPLSIETAVHKLRVPESIAGVVVPLGATVNMAGTALYQSVAVIFLAQMAGIELSLGELSVIVVTLVASSIGAPGTPGVGIVILSNVVTGFGIPVGGLVLVLGVDRILDMSRTVVNVTGDLVACVLLRGSAGTKTDTIKESASAPSPA